MPTTVPDGLLSTADVAERLGTEPRVLRIFLRSDWCSFHPVGSGLKYVFEPADLPELSMEFDAWMSRPRNQTEPEAVAVNAPDGKCHFLTDQTVWAEEDEARGGPLVLENLNDSGVRERVRRVAREQEHRLIDQMTQAGIVFGRPSTPEDWIPHDEGHQDWTADDRAA